MVENDDWTAPWAARVLRENDRVSAITIVALGRLQIERDDMPPVAVATLNVARLDHALLAKTLSSPPVPDFVLNLAGGELLTTEALHLSIREKVPVGRMGDLQRALSMPQVREYVDPETRFRERGLEQHSRVADYQRLDLHRYRITRIGLPPLIVLFLNDYELSADAIRHAHSEYGAFDIVVASNPNGQITDYAAGVAGQLGCEIYKWGPFLSRLHRKNDKR